MKAQRIIALTKKEMKKTVREPAVLFMIFLFPVVFVFAFGASFGGGGSTHPVYSIGVVNLDRGTTGSQILLGAMSNTTILDLHRYLDNKTAKTELSQGHLQAVIVIPPEFSQSLASYLGRARYSVGVDEREHHPLLGQGLSGCDAGNSANHPTNPHKDDA